MDGEQLSVLELLSELIRVFDTPNVQSDLYHSPPALPTDYRFDFKQIKDFIHKKVRAFERKHHCTVLCAVEKSSHIWGTANASSDNDVHCLFFYPQRAYYSVTNFRAEMARSNQNSKRNRKNTRKQQDLEEFRENTFHRWMKVQYGHRFDGDPVDQHCSEMAHTNDVSDWSLDVEISFHEISKFMTLAMDSNQNLYEMVCSPITYHVVDPGVWKKFRNLIWNLFDYMDLADCYRRLARKNYNQWTHATTNRTNRDDRKRIKTMFVIWRALLMADWILTHCTVCDVPLWIPILVEQTKLLSKEEKEKFLNKLCQINGAVYAVDHSFEVLREAAESALDSLTVRCSNDKQNCSTHRKDKTMEAQALDDLIAEMIESL